MAASLQWPGSGPGASFEQPFELLEACHERVGRMVDLLGRLREHLGTHGADLQAQQAAHDVMRYFDLAAPQHHRDEELHVFPPLLAQADAATLALVSRLQQDHLRMESLWVEARRVLDDIAEARVDRLAAAQDTLLADFAALYPGHIEAEEQLVYPAARSVLAPEALATMGDEMMRRRGAG